MAEPVLRVITSLPSGHSPQSSPSVDDFVITNLARQILANKQEEGKFLSALLPSFEPVVAGFNVSKAGKKFLQQCHIPLQTTQEPISFENPSYIDDQKGNQILIEYLEEAIYALQDNEPELQASFYLDLAEAFLKRGRPATKGVSSDLNRAIDAVQDALSLPFENKKLRLSLHRYLDRTLSQKMWSLPLSEREYYLNLLLVNYSRELPLITDEEEKKEVLEDYASGILKRTNFAQSLSEEMADLDSAIELYKKLASSSLKPASKMEVYRTLGDLFLDKFRMQNGENFHFLHLALEYYEKELTLFNAEQWDRNTVDLELVEKLQFIAEQFLKNPFKYPSNLEDGIRILRLCLPFSEDKAFLGITLAKALFCRDLPSQNGSRSDLEEGCLLCLQAIKTPEFKQYHASFRIGVLNKLTAQLEKRNQPGDLESIIKFCEEGLAMLVDEELPKGQLSLRLGRAFFKRNLPSQQGQPGDLARAFQVLVNGLNFHFDDDMLRGDIYYRIGQVYESSNQLNEAISAYSTAITYPCSNIIQLANRIGSLSQLLIQRNLPAQNGQPSDANFVIQSCGEVLDLAFDNDELRAKLWYLKALALSLRNLLRDDGWPLDLVASIHDLQRALELTHDREFIPMIQGELEAVLRERRRAMKFVIPPSN